MPGVCRSIRQAAVAVAVLPAVVFAGGCGSDSEQALTTGRAAVKADLLGRSFVVTEASEHELVEGVTVGIGFSDGSGAVPDNYVNMSSGCNPSSGKYTLVGGKLQIESLFTSAVGCGSGLEAQDEWMGQLLLKRPAVRIHDGGKTLVLATSDESLTFAATPSRRGPEGPPRHDATVGSPCFASASDTGGKSDHSKFRKWLERSEKTK